MVHPIAKMNQYPFTIGGLIVNGAKIKGETFVKELYILQQRSDLIYDLVSSDGKVYTFVTITWMDENLKDLDYFDEDDDLVSTIPDDTFFIKVQDVKENIYGFMTLIQLNKIKVHTGKYIYVHEEEEVTLRSVKLIPPIVQANVGDIIDIDIEFDPPTVENKRGNWIMTNSNIVRMIPERSTSTKQSYECLYEGAAYAVFIPEANPLVTGSSTVLVKHDDKPPIPVLTDYAIAPNYYENTIGAYTNYGEYYPGQEVVYSIIGIPYSSVLEDDLEITYTVVCAEEDVTNDIFDVIETNDPMVYKLKVKESIQDIPLPPTSYDEIIRWDVQVKLKSSIREDEMSCTVRQFIPKTTPIPFSAPLQMCVGSPQRINVLGYGLPQYGHVFVSEDETMATIDQTGHVTPLRAGTCYINCYHALPDGSIDYDAADSRTAIKIWDGLPSKIRYYPNDKFTYEIGEQQQFTYVTEPPGIVLPSDSYWDDNRNGGDTRYALMTRTGHLTVKAMSGNGVPSDLNTYYTALKPNYPVGSSFTGDRMFGIAIVAPGSVYPPTSYRMNQDYGNGYNVIPVNGIDDFELLVSMVPLWTTGDKKSIVEVSDESVISIEYDEYLMNAYSTFPIYIKGLKKGASTITVRSVQDHSVTMSRTIYVV